MRQLRGWDLTLVLAPLVLSCARGSAPVPAPGRQPAAIVPPVITSTPANRADTTRRGIIVDVVRPVESPLVVLNGQIVRGTHRDSALALQRAVILDSIRVYPAGAATAGLFGTEAVGGVIFIFTRPRP